MRMVVGQEHVGTAAGECVPPHPASSPALRFRVPEVNLAELRTCGLLLAGGGDEK